MEKIVQYEANHPARDILQYYISKVCAIKSLEASEEHHLAVEYFEHKNINAAKKLVEGHLKLVVKIAMKYRNFGQPVVDLISEGNLGLIRAVEKFDPHAGFRLSTYAMFWIKSNIQEYILKTWSLVKIGTTALQKKLFYSLSKLKAQITKAEGRSFQESDYAKIAGEIGCTKEEVSEIDTRISGHDISLNRPVARNYGGAETIDYVKANTLDPEARMVGIEEANAKKKIMNDALQILNLREREIFVARKLMDEQKTLDDLSKAYGISKERVRQLEVRAMEKIRQFVLEHAARYMLAVS